LMVRREADLILLATWSLGASALTLAFPSQQAVRIALGLPFLLFGPGYAVLAALYPRRADLAATERLALSLGFSLAVLSVVALGLSYSPFGLRWEPLVASVSLLVLAASALAVLHRHLVPPGERLDISVRLRPRAFAALRRRLLTAGAIALAAATASLAVALLALLPGKRAEGTPHTEFYLLGPGGRAESLPNELALGDAAVLTVGVANREGAAKTYGITVSIDGDRIEETAGVGVGPGQLWQRPIVLAPRRAGEDELVRFDLHMDGGASPYRTLYFRLDVLAPPAPSMPVLAEERKPEPTPSPEATLAPAPIPTPTPAPPQPRVHAVKAGENLTVIAELYSVSLGAVIQANQLENPNLIHPNEQIVIPAQGLAGEDE